MSPDPNGPDRPRAESRLVRRVLDAQNIGTWTAIPVMIVVGLVGGFFLGQWLEGRYGHAPWLSFGGMVLGGVASVRKVVQTVRSEQRRQQRGTRRRPR